MHPLQIPPRIAPGKEPRRGKDPRLLVVTVHPQPRPVVRAVLAVRAAAPSPNPLDVLALRDVEDREPILLVLADRDHRVLHALRFELARRSGLALVELHRV